jgi:hypothetical protein
MQSETTSESARFSGDNATEYKHIRSGLIRVVKGTREYVPIVDDLYINTIARYTIHMKRLDRFIESDTATEHTYSRVIDSQVKLAKIIDDAIHRLAISGQDRLTSQKEAEITLQFRETLRRLQNAGENRPTT